MEKRMGRPPKAPGEAKSQVYQLRLTADEREQWESAAAKAGKTLSEWIRERLNRAAKR
jgi:predicted HicB family RNase H-like nuclease